MCSSRSIWGTIRSKQWTEANSRAVCRNLGYSDGIVILYFSIHSYYILHCVYEYFTQEHPTPWIESQLPCQLLWTMSGVRVQRTH